VINVCYGSDVGALEDQAIEALDFIFRAAGTTPVVASVSLGTNFGPHNGSTDFDFARDNLLNSFQNRAIVWSAGNNNDKQGFQTGTIAAGATETINATNWAMRFWVDIWYRGPEIDFRVTHSGSNTGWIAAGSDFDGALGGNNIEVTRAEEAGMRAVHFYVDREDFVSAWTLEMRNPGGGDVQYYAWSAVQGVAASFANFTADEMTLTDTGCGRSILTVGACSKVIPPNPASGELITSYSSAGPTIDGRIKPEIVAVGGDSANKIMSCASNQGSGYIGKDGTSMAAPLAAGGVALMLQEYTTLGKDLNHDSIKALLTQDANRTGLHVDPNQAGYVATERNLYGYGRFRLIAPIDHIRPPLNVDVWIRTADDDYGVQPYPGGCFCCAPDIKVYDAANNETTQLHWGDTYKVKVTARNLGDDDAVGTTVKLMYTLPWAAPKDWHVAEGTSNNALEQTVTVPALGQTDLEFQWRPDAGEIAAPADTTHFCLLAELDHPSDHLAYSQPNTGGGDAWSENIKGTNNVALRNLHLQ